VRTLLLLLVLIVLLSSTAFAAIQSNVVEYKQGDTVLEGYLAYDDSIVGNKPGVLVIHDWLGVGEYVQSRARQLASMGYVAFAPDIYGKGIRPDNDKAASALVGQYKNDRKLLRLRAIAGLDILRNQPQVDPKRLAAIGYCFGGTTALELARSGASIAAVISFHGGLDTPTPEDARNIRAKVLALHGADDPFVPPDQVKAFENEMRQAGVDWQLAIYGGAVHAFTIPGAGSDKSKGAAYDAKADKRSFEAMKVFFKEVFGD
jgi:dienelactone hydrolase